MTIHFKSCSVNSLVVVADGTRARLLRVTMGDSGHSLEEKESVSPTNLAGEGPSGSRPPEQSNQQTDEATFAKQLADKLYQMAHAEQFEELVLIADPQTLGQVRELLHVAVTSKIKEEIAKTLTNSSIKEIESQLR